jgi:hypothetical protein
MKAQFRIDSRENQASLELRPYDDYYFIAEARGSSMQATALVASYQSWGMPQFFADLAAHWKGFEGTKSWASFEDELTLSARSDRTGHVYVGVQLTKGHPPIWSIEVELVLEAGQLDHIAAAAQAFEAESIKIS